MKTENREQRTETDTKTENREQIQIQKLRSDKNFLFSVFRFCFCFCFLFSIFCCSRSNPAWEYMPDMADQPALKAYQYDPNLPHQRSAFAPVAGTIPHGYQPYPYPKDPEGAGENLKNPLPRTEEVLLAGQKTFNVYCSVCHGVKGLGDGTIIPKFPKPPSLLSEKLREWPDGRIFHVITEGQNLMPSYASQVDSNQRWAVIHYIRVLQRAEGAMVEDVEAYKRRITNNQAPITK